MREFLELKLAFMKSKHLFGSALLLLTLLMIYKIISLPFDLVDEANEVLPQKISMHKAALEKADKTFEMNRKDERLSAYYRFEKPDHWQENFESARQKLVTLEHYLQNNIKKVLQENKASQTEFLKSQIAYMHKTLNEVQKLYERPDKRLNVLMQLQNTAPSTIEKRVGILNEYDVRYKALVQRYLQRSKEFPHQKEQLTLLIQEILQQYKSLQKYLDQAAKELTKENIDLLRVERKLNKYEKGYTTLVSKHQEFEDILKGLTQSYTKILVDMKVERKISVDRISWDERSDGGEVTRTFNDLLVNKSAYLKVLQYQNVALARVTFSKLSSSVFKSLPSTMVKLPSSHTHAEFYLNEASEKFYHKYAIIENDKISFTHFEEVQWSYFEAHIPHLGMEIVNKPYGEFETRYIENYAAPSGMNFADKSAYGNWGGRYGDIWSFNTLYAKMNQFLVTNITTTEFKTWKALYKNKKTYYGKNLELGTFGSQTFRNRLYKNSYFYKTYVTNNGSKFRDIFKNYADAFSKQKRQYVNHSNQSSHTGGFFYYSSGSSGYSSHYNDYDNRTRKSHNYGYKRSQPSVKNAGSRSRGRGPGGGGK